MSNNGVKMPIDDKLGDLEGEGKKKEPEKDSSASESPNTLVAKAREVMGNVLVDYFKGNLPGQNQQLNIDDYCSETIKKAGFDLFKIVPRFNKTNRRKVLVPHFANDLNDEQIKEMVKIVCGEYILKTDAANLANKKKFKELMNLMPEFARLREDLFFSDKETYANYYRTTLHPQIIVMGMASEHKPLATLAVDRAMDDKCITPLIARLDICLTGTNTIDKILMRMTPPSNYFFEVAEKYGAQEVIPVINNFKAVCEVYKNEWK